MDKDGNDLYLAQLCDVIPAAEISYDSSKLIKYIQASGTKSL